MTPSRTLFAAAASALLIALCHAPLAAQEPFTPAAEFVNKRMVKLFGAGGFKGLPGYGTGLLVSKDGYILTVNNHILGTTDLKVHLYDGRIYSAKVVAREPELDVALLKIDTEVSFLPFFDIPKLAKNKMAEAGDWVLACSNQFKIGQRNEPMSVQRGVVAAHTELRSQRGFFDAPYMGDVYFIDTVCCNPGAAGGALTTYKGELLGIIGRELKHTLSNTWINYAVPIQAKAAIQREDDKGTITNAVVDIPTFVKEAMENKYRQSSGKKRDRELVGGFHGIVLVPNSVSVTPPYIEEVLPNSPAFEKGLRPDDLIVYIDGELVPSIRVFRDIMRAAQPGNEIVLEVQRGDRLETVKLKLQPQPKPKVP